MATDPHPWAAEPEPLLAQVWARLVRGLGDRHAPARHLALATVSPSGAPEGETVVLRAADPGAGTLDLHTDLRSASTEAELDFPTAPDVALAVVFLTINPVAAVRAEGRMRWAALRDLP